MRHIVIDRGIDLRGMEIGSRIRVTEILAIPLSIAVILMDAEVGTASLLAGFVSLPVCFVAAACTWAPGDDARGCVLLPCEVRDRRARSPLRGSG